jgi:hypothetical protein
MEVILHFVKSMLQSGVPFLTDAERNSDPNHRFIWMSSGGGPGAAPETTCGATTASHLRRWFGNAGDQNGKHTIIQAVSTAAPDKRSQPLTERNDEQAHKQIDGTPLPSSWWRW